MPIIAKGDGNFTPAPAGLHQAVCVDVVDLGIKETKWGDKHKVQIRWQIDKVNEKGKSFLVVQNYTLSLNEKAGLRKHLDAWRGKKFTKEELEGFDLESLIGVNCQLQVVHNEYDGKVFANVQAVVPLGKGMEKMEPEDYVRTIDRPDQNGGESLPQDVPAESTEDLPF